jgi:hypothetical protein
VSLQQLRQKNLLNERLGLIDNQKQLVEMLHLFFVDVTLKIDELNMLLKSQESVIFTHALVYDLNELGNHNCLCE